MFLQYAVPYLERIVIFFVHICAEEYRAQVKNIYRFMKKYSLGQAQTGDNGKTEVSRVTWKRLNTEMPQKIES